jgi:hypothetical protein
MSSLNRYSYVLASILLIAAGIAYAIISPRPDIVGTATLLVGALLLIYWVAVRRGNLTPVNPLKRIRRARGSDRPVVVCFYGDYSLGSLLKRPFTAKVEKAYKGKCDFIYIDVDHREADDVLEELQAEMGDFVLYDAAGNFVSKSPMINLSTLEDLCQRKAH